MYANLQNCTNLLIGSFYNLDFFEDVKYRYMMHGDTGCRNVLNIWK